jgi:hypothetical protein
MKVAISSNEVINSLYARSALRAMAARQPDGLVGFMLTPDHVNALIPVVKDAFMWSASMCEASYVNVSQEEFYATFDVEADPEPLVPLLIQATILAAEYFLLGAACAPNIEPIMKKAQRLLMKFRTQIVHITPY